MNKLFYFIAILYVLFLIHYEYTLDKELIRMSNNGRRYDDYFKVNDYLMYCDSFTFIGDDEIVSNKKTFFCEMKLSKVDGDVAYSVWKPSFVGIRDTVSNMLYLMLSYAGDFRKLPSFSNDVLLDARKRSVYVSNGNDYLLLHFVVLDSSDIEMEKFENENTVRF